MARKVVGKRNDSWKTIGEFKLLNDNERKDQAWQQYRLIEEYVVGLLMALQKPDGGIRPILCGEVWRRCFASLAVNTTPIRDEEAKLFTSS